MSYKMSKSAFKELIQADIEYLKTMCLPTLERSHIINVLNDYVNIAYPKKALDGLKKSNKIMSKVEAKFKCSSVEHFENGKKVKAQPVLSGSEENKSFAKYTPSGSIEILVDNETNAADFFHPGVEFYVTFSNSKPE